MYESSFNTIRFAAIESLQASLTHRNGAGILTERSPGSDSSVILEQAIDYALSPARLQAVPAFLEHQVRRDARKAVRRRADAEARGLADIATICAPPNQAFTGRVRSNSVSSATEDRPERPPSVHSCGPTCKIAGTAIVSAITPEDITVASAMERQLRAKVMAELGIPALGVLNGMLAGETVPDSARRLGLITRTIDRYRAKIRVIASVIWAIDEAAA